MKQLSGLASRVMFVSATLAIGCSAESPAPTGANAKSAQATPTTAARQTDSGKAPIGVRSDAPAATASPTSVAPTPTAKSDRPVESPSAIQADKPSDEEELRGSCPKDKDR